MNGAAGQGVTGDSVPGVLPTTTSFPNSSPSFNESSPLITKVERYGAPQIQAPGDLVVDVASSRRFALIVFVILAVVAVWTISILPEMALSLG